MADTLTCTSPTPSPQELVSEAPGPDPVEQFLEVFSRPAPRTCDHPKDKKGYFEDWLKKYQEDKDLIEHLKGPEQPALPLIVESKWGYVEAFQVLLKSGHFDNTEICDSHGRTALSYAAELQKGDFIKFLLQEGANTDAKDNNGCTPLSWAAATGCGTTGYPYNQKPKTISSILISHGVDINSADNEKHTPLIWAIMQGSATIINELLDWERIKVNC